MNEMKCATLIGDLVGSREVADRAELHRRFQDAIDRANTTLEPLTPLRITVGDEYQGTFATVGEALHAALWLRLQMLPHTDLRHGIGWGPVVVLQQEPLVEEGAGWWAARDAIVAVEEDATRPGTRALRARYQRAPGTDGPHPAAINAALLCRDQLLAQGDDRTIRLLRGLLDGRSKKALAKDEGISPSAVSQRDASDGLSVLLAADALLREVA